MHHQELSGMGRGEFCCGTFLADHEHDGPPGVGSSFSPLGHLKEGRDAGDQQNLKVQGQPYRARSAHIGSEAPSSRKLVGLPVMQMLSPRYQ